jgi:hypothetical protein
MRFVAHTTAKVLILAGVVVLGQTQMDLSAITVSIADSKQASILAAQWDSNSVSC